MDTEAVNANSGIDRSSIWFADGGIILQAEKTQFCVHSGVLSMHSVVFRDMLTFPQGDGPVEQVEGRPLVRVLDKADDMAFLLQALYDPSPLPRMSLNEETAARLCAVLRLSAKYLILHLRTAVSHAFHEAYPSDLSSWDKSPLKVLAPDRSWVIWPFELAVANSLTQAQLFSPLPNLFYRLARGMKEWSIFESDLDLLNKKIIFTSYERYQVGRGLFFHSAFASGIQGGPECESNSFMNCRYAAMVNIVYLPSTKEAMIPSACEPLDFDFKRIFDENSELRSMKICAPCKRRWDSATVAARQAFWTALPKMFNMDNWEALRQVDVRYLENMATTRP